MPYTEKLIVDLDNDPNYRPVGTAYAPFGKINVPAKMELFYGNAEKIGHIKSFHFNGRKLYGNLFVLNSFMEHIDPYHRDGEYIDLRVTAIFQFRAPSNGLHQIDEIILQSVGLNQGLHALPIRSEVSLTDWVVDF